jgi:hypothetical protein
MKRFVVGVLIAFSLPAVAAQIDNPAIDMEGHLRLGTQAALHRAERRISEREFLQMSRQPGTVVLDARSRDRFDELHVAGAINLAFPDITIASLDQTIPDRATRILIYCNNNFLNAQRPFPAKLATASLNLSTYVTLYTYGYRNVYELGPLIEVEKSILPLEGTTARR